ncbi:MAG: aldo/keto reductase [Gammaproteobacteria bacterium]|jgi:diketogulonate reductase-like aldo/keto reductase|nr:aldo/keto reductase [Gammaproteobacteria bacterium]
MTDKTFSERRRKLIKSGLGMLASMIALPQLAISQTNKNTLIKKAIPSTGESIPVVGLGTSRTFDASQQVEQIKLLPVLEAFFANGGSLIDSSPMYGAAQETVGRLLQKLDKPETLFSATKVWIEGKQAGIDQMQQSMDLWGIDSFDLMQIHNLKDWQSHLETLREWKEQGKIRYIGITTSHNRFHEELVDIMNRESLDFVQFTYNIDNRTSEKSLLPIAFDKGIAVLVNRPFQRGDLFRRVKGKELPDWAGELGINSWGQYFLKFAVSHPAVTCAIPATSKVKHMVDNMQAGYGELPDTATRQRMIKYLQKI